MTPSQVADVQGALLTLALGAVGVGAVASAVSARARHSVLALLGGTGTVLAAAVALAATAGSLWYSESAGFPPCDLCWYQRISMYPLPIVLGLAGFRASATARAAGMVVAGVGLAVSTWHNVIETFPDVSSGSCDPNAPCTVRWVEGLGFWTIPRMAAACFLLVLVLCAIDVARERSGERT